MVELWMALLLYGGGWMDDLRLMVGHEPLMPEGFHHYDLHVWFWRENPAGLFAPTNPAMECSGSHVVKEDAPDLVSGEESGN